MTRLGSLLLAGLLFVVASAQAQSDDPSETFLKAYMTAQQGEKLERDNQFTRALAKYRLAGSLLEELKKAHSEWQPAIVEYRSRKISESILRVQSKSGTRQDLAATNPPPAETQPSPQRSSEPTVEVGPSKSKPSIIVQPADQASPPPKEREAAAPALAPPASDAAIKNATRKLRDKVEQLEAELQHSRSKVSEVEEEKEKLNSKLKESNSKLEQAQQELERTKGAEKDVRGQLAEAKAKKAQELAGAMKQLEDLRAQLAASEKQNKDFEVEVASLRSQLEDTSSQLEKAKLTGVNAEETAKLTRENQILRNIVVRERQEEARREQAKKLMLAEFDKLKIKSDTLNEQVALLAQPVTKLTDEELALLRQPVISISDESPNTVKASFTYAKPSTGNQPGEPIVETTESPAPPAANLQNGFKPNVPTDLLDIARQAKENFDQGKYHAAERQYQELLTKSPNNLYSLSNLGVVYFRTGKLKAAELTLKKAVAIAPKDEFAHTTLGIVYYRQSKFDDSLNELTKSVAINPKSAAAHNYLGITASQKGWQEAAEKEMLEAIAVKPGYADAHFNLAVIYATASPPSKELAKRHYAKATELGAQPDASLEKLLR